MPSFPCAKGIRELSNLFLDDSSRKEEYLQSKTYNYINDLNGALTMLRDSIFCRKGYTFDRRGVYFSVQYVAQYPDGTSIRTLKAKTQFLRRLFQLSVNEVFRMKAEHLSFKMKVLAS